MSEWKKVKLGELYEVHNGLSKGRQFFGTGFPFLTFSNVFNNWFLPDQLESLVQTTDKEREACSIKAGDVFITRTSETMDELGMSSVALKDYPNATYNGFTKRLRPKTDRVFPRYMGYYLRTPKFRGQFMAFSSMTTRASLANNDLLNMEVELPPMDIQKNIATILSRYDSLIENYQKQIKLLEEAAQRLYKEWFVDLHFPGHENTNIIDGVPEGWEKKKIKDIAEVNKNEDIPNHTLLVGGFPCQDFSIAAARWHKSQNNKYGLKGDKSSLFYEFLRLKEEIKPKYFLLENVKMKKESERELTKYLGVSPITINSKLVSFQNRPRLYWTNIPNITIPVDKQINFQDYKDADIIRCEESKVNKTPSRERMWNNGKGAETYKNCNNITNAIKIGCLTRKQDRCPNSGLIEYEDFCRYLTRRELELAQTLPPGYCDSLTFNQVQDVTGDGWTVDVISHLFKGLV